MNKIKILLIAFIGIGILLCSIAVYFCFFYNPLVSITLPIKIVCPYLVDHYINLNMETTEVFAVLELFQNGEWRFGDNTTLRPVQYADGWFIYIGQTSKAFKSEDKIRITVFVNDSQYGRTLILTLPKIHQDDIEIIRHDFYGEQKWVICSFLIGVDPLDTDQPSNPFCINNVGIDYELAYDTSGKVKDNI